MADADDLVRGRYRLESLLGEGGMGEVWLARDELLHREVAVKRLRMPPDLAGSEAAQRMARMEREARAAAALQHRGIVAVHDRFTDANGAPWIVMEFVPGCSLAQVIGEEGRLSPERTARIGAQIADALAAAHRAGVVHRDIKPANILLDGERVVLTDFGIAAFEGATTLTPDGGLMGTPAYMSPEQVNGDRGTSASDLWSLGVTLYHAVEGRRAFTGPNLASTLLAVSRGEPAPTVHAGPLEPVLRDLMSKDPAARPTAAEAAARLSLKEDASRTGEGTAVPEATVRLSDPDGAFSPASPTVPSPPLQPAASPSSPGRRRLLLAMGAVGAAVALPSVYYSFGREGSPQKAKAAPPPSPSILPASWKAPRHDGESLTTFGDVSSVVFSPDGRTLAVATSTPEGDRAQLWDLATRTMRAEFPKPAAGQAGADEQILRAAFSPDGKILATAMLEGSVRLWDAAAGTQAGEPLEHDGTVKDVAFSPDGRLLATAGLDELVRLWDVAARNVVRTFDPKFRLTLITAVAFAAKGDLLAAGSEGAVRLWDLGSEKSWLLRAKGEIGQLAFSPDGRLLAAGGSGEGGGTMMVWDTATRTRLKRGFKGTDDHEFLSAVAFSPDGGTLAAASSENRVWLWNVATGAWATDPLVHSGMVKTVAFSPDGRLLATGTEFGDGAVHLWRP